jgi:hypothetical protein
MNKEPIILNDVIKKDKEIVHHIIPSLPFNQEKGINTAYFMIHHWMASVLDLTGTELMLYALIFNFCNTSGNVCYCSRKAFGGYLNTSEVTITASIKKLEEKNLIIVERTTINNVNVNYYVVNLEVLFKALSNYDINIDFSKEDLDTTNIATIQFDKLHRMAEEYNNIKNTKENTNEINKTTENTNNEEVVNNLNGVVKNLNDVVNNLNTNNIINNINDNIVETKDNINIIFSSADAHSETSLQSYTNTSIKESNDIVSNDCINDKTNLNNIDSISEIDSKDNTLLNDLSNTHNDKQEIKPKKKKEFVLNTKGDKPKPKRNTKSNRAKETAKMFVLIKQLFANDEVNELNLVEILTQYLQSRLGMKEAKALTYEVWQSQLELLIKICEGDYKYAEDVATQAYLGQYRVLCFPNQQKSNKTYNGYNGNKKYGYEIEANDEFIQLSNTERKERKQVLNTRIAKNTDGNNFKF